MSYPEGEDGNQADVCFQAKSRLVRQYAGSPGFQWLCRGRAPGRSLHELPLGGMGGERVATQAKFLLPDEIQNGEGVCRLTRVSVASRRAGRAGTKAQLARAIICWGEGVEGVANQADVSNMQFD